MAPGPQHPAAGGDQEAYTLSQRGLRPDRLLCPEAPCSVLPGVASVQAQKWPREGSLSGSEGSQDPSRLP